MYLKSNSTSIDIDTLTETNSEFTLESWCLGDYPPGSTNIAGLLENGPEMKMYFLLKMGRFQPAMLVYQRVTVKFATKKSPGTLVGILSRLLLGQTAHFQGRLLLVLGRVLRT